MNVSTIPSYAPIAGTLTLLGLAVTFTRAWVNDVDDRAVEQLRVLGMRPGRNFKLGGSWARAAVRDPRNAVWGFLAVGTWAMLLGALAVVRP